MARMQLGEQHVDWGYHGGRKISQHGQFEGCGYSLLDDPELAEEHYEWVREIVTKYKNDERIVMWDVFNEPGNSKRGNLSLPHMKKFENEFRNRIFHMFGYRIYRPVFSVYNPFCIP